MLLRAENVQMEFGGFRALAGASLDIAQGEIIGLIGPNGAGKSTFFNCLVGDLTPTGGRIDMGQDQNAARSCAARCPVLPY